MRRRQQWGKTGWQRPPRSYRQIVSSALEHDVPIPAVAFYSRWWQLEHYIRSIVYLELRARYGIEWLTRLGPDVRRRAERDSANVYMASVDADDALAYADFSELLGVIDNEEDWPLFEISLLPRVRWRGAADELRDLRNRIMHARRPHRDDVSRLEAVLRDLETGAHQAFRPYAQPHVARELLSGVMASAWIDGNHQGAHLIRHGENQYGTQFRLMYSLRPWAASDLASKPNPGAGLMWHCFWSTRDGWYSMKEFWDDYYLDEVRGLLVHALQSNPWSLSVTFSGADDPNRIADALELCYDAALGARREYGRDDTGTDEPWREEDWIFPSKVQAGTVISRADSLTFGDFFGVS